MLEVGSITRFYGETCAVNQVSFTIGTGEIVGLLGHNGAGKTTIMKMISGYLEPDAGRIQVDGIELSQDALQAQAKIGYLPENLPVYPEMMVGAYLDYAADLKGLKGNDKLQAIREAVIATDLQAKVPVAISTLSRGFRQRVGVAQAILGSPKVLILDEPTNGLDPSQTELMRELIRSIAKNATVILSTHIMQEVEALCDRVLIIDRGELRLDRNLGDFQQSTKLLIECSLTAFELEALVADHPLFKQVEQSTSGLVVSMHASNAENTEPAVIKQFSSELAKLIVNAGAELFSIAPLAQDLETLFKEASSGVSTGRATRTSLTEEEPHAA